jgi:hypothetical protein
MMWKYLLVLLPVVAHADMNDCVNIADQNKKNYCMATYSGSSTFCEKIQHFGDRTQCMRMVVAAQRRNVYQTPKPPSKEETK